MNTDDFSKFLQQKATRIEAYARNHFPDKAGKISLRFIDDNFKKQGWQGAVFQPWKRNKKGTTILIKSGMLRRGNYYTTTPGVAHVKDNIKYGGVHNSGYNGSVEIPAHTRKTLGSTKRPTGRTFKTGRKQMQTIHSISATVSVKAHTRQMNIPKRQFFPEKWNDSPILVKEMQTEIFNALKKIM